jgi:isoleucyl-tRNA synthetase
VLADAYVTDSSGTGIVHQAPAFGEDDHRICVAHGIVRDDEIPPCPIDESGKFTSEVPEYQGRYVKVSIKELTLGKTRAYRDRKPTATLPST